MSIRPVMAQDIGVTVPLGFPTDEQALAVSPTRPAISPQDHIEPVMLEHARGLLGVDVRFDTALVGLEQDDAGVRATVRDMKTGAVSIVCARYLIGADGTRSAVRDALGISTTGADGLGEYLSILFRANLWDRLPGERFGLYRLEGPVAGVFVPAGPDDRWVFGVQQIPGQPPLDNVTPEQCIELVRRAAGMPDLDVEIITSMPLQFVAQAADRVREGNVFLIGDAAHRMPPMGGRGMNTAIADSVGLGWKLAWVLKGWAPATLLETYEQERGPVGRYNLQLATRAVESTPEGLLEDLGYVYHSAAIEAMDDAGEAAPGYLFPTVATPGARLPHAWLRAGTGRLSTHDLVGPGLTLFTGPQGQAWIDAVEGCRAGAPMPLQGHVIGAELDSADGAFCDRFGLGADGAVLVRPDGHIAWRREAGSVSDHAEALAAAIALCRGLAPAPREMVALAAAA
jgi:2-polyprenyl-6-methoxyphenol hydroxylase-like FAD-dependent oxidoreductase